MPPVDLETLVSACAGGSCTDTKISCETLAGDNNLSNNRNLQFDEDSDDDDFGQPEVPPDYPPESFWLSKDAELDWFDRNAFFDRKDSSKGTNSNSANLNPNLNPSSNSSSQRFSHKLKSKASIIGLPKPQKSCFVDSKNRRTCKRGNTQMFPKRSGSVAKSDASAYEPSSPKVSCMGRVRSKRDRNRRLRNRQQQRSAVPEPEKPNPKPAATRKTGLFASFRAIFRTGCRESEAASAVDAPRGHAVSQLDVHDIRNRLPVGEIDAPPRKSVAGEAPGLGGMQRFVSGRRSGSWGVGELDGELAKS